MQTELGKINIGWGTRKDHIEWGNSDPGRQMFHVVSHLGLLTPNRDMWVHTVIHTYGNYRAQQSQKRSLRWEGNGRPQPSEGEVGEWGHSNLKGGEKRATLY